jgi:hypothetical protein
MCLPTWFADHRSEIEVAGLNPFAQAASLTILAEYERAPDSVEALGALNRWPGRSGVPDRGLPAAVGGELCRAQGLAAIAGPPTRDVANCLLTAMGRSDDCSPPHRIEGWVVSKKFPRGIANSVSDRERG